MPRLFALALLVAMVPQPAHPLPQPTRMVTLSVQGARQHAYFAQRLAGMALRIERRQRARILSRGQAAFMQQDLIRVGDGIGRILRHSVALSPEEDRSYRAMLDRVDARLVRAEAKRAVRLAS